MKKVIFLITITFLMISCQNNETDVNKNIGEILSGNNKGSTYLIGSMEDAQLALDFSTAFVNQDYDLSIALVEGKYQPTFFMAKKGIRNSLGKFIDRGGRKIMHWVKQTNFTSVEFTNPKNFINLNSKNDIQDFKKNN